ncbi:MAG TPA: serine/threonine-protein kinase [Gemmataceae bacterium]|nr:serine/threonine-protein kinase [Gemmataceae bacterium]
MSESLPAILGRLARLPAAVAADAARADQDGRWRAGESPPAEAYLAGLPAVAADPDQAMVLIYGEVVSRSARGESPALAEYQARFPHLAARLALQFELHVALDAPHSTTGAYVPASHNMPPPERFVSGSLLAGRYRVVAPLGKGGMGEVYRADDLTLGQPVALKFLPAHLARDPDRLARFRKEVAAARRVSHPNACRVYDIADHAGDPFLSMEFVDGEDLGSVLRRLGRVPEEKGIQIARQLCSALAAVHDQGLLHRDLKPANVMLDGRGRVRLTDFGLAAAAADLSATEVRSGTPLYQAPEQQAGREVTARSDLYALGLVLYELFTGRRPFADANRDTPPSKPSSHVSGLSPAVEGLILKSLEPDPADRPRSAAEVRARLPGGDPLAAVVAAGDTPSPRLVANADPGEGRLRPGTALALVGVVAVGIVFCGWAGGLTVLGPRVGMRDAEPAVMRHKAREVLAVLGHTEIPADSAVRYLGNHEFLEYQQANDPTPGTWDGRWRGLEDGRPPAMVFFYRTARRPLAPTNYHVLRDTSGQVDPLSPPPIEPGMADVALDFRGRLVRFHKVADYFGPAAPPPAAVPDWGPAFAAAGLDFTGFTATAPRHQPPLAFDSRLAWEGPYPDPAVDRFRVEAASLAGAPVYFAVEYPWQTDARSVYTFAPDPAPPAGFIAIVYGLPLLAAGLAWLNWRAGRTDLAGAGKIAGLLFALWLARWVFTAHHVADGAEQTLFHSGIGLAVYEAAVVAVCYLALEPVVRKRWPWRLVAWNRLLVGRVTDPLIARDVLIGLATGVGFSAAVFQYRLGPAWAPELIRPYAAGEYEFDPARCVLNPVTVGVRMGFLYFLLMFLAHWACRRPRLGSAVFVLALATLFLAGGTEQKPLTLLISVVVSAGGLQLIGLRFGLLAFVAAMLPFGWLVDTGWTLDVRAWYAAGPNLGVALLLALTGYAAYTATGGRLFGRPADAT